VGKAVTGNEQGIDNLEEKYIVVKENIKLSSK
jgi:hypothetical protein